MNFKSYTLLVAFLLTGVLTGYAQFNRDLQNYRYPDQRGVDVFESPKTDTEFDGVQVRLGGAFALQFQGLNHSNNAQPGEANELNELSSDFNLATANLDLDVALYDGVRLHLRTYLSSRHHAEAWVKGGYLQVDKLDFISEDFASDLMENLRFKVGHMELNYGDAHFRRSDNGTAIHNPFVGNYIMDAFTTEVAGEIYYFQKSWFAMFGLSNGKLNQSTVQSDPGASPTVYGKLGYDSQINDDFRVRVTGSVLGSSESVYQYLYHGDRAGSRYYNVFNDGFTSGRFAPDFTVSGRNPIGPVAGEMTSIMINPFLKYQGLEFFGLYEITSGKTAVETETRSYNQYGFELLYRFGGNENFYLGGRYNMVAGDERAVTDVPNNTVVTVGEVDIARFNIGGGWFLTKNVLTKLEYVKQTYGGQGFDNTKYAGGEFNGFMVEAVIGF